MSLSLIQATADEALLSQIEAHEEAEEAEAAQTLKDNLQDNVDQNVTHDSNNNMTGNIELVKNDVEDEEEINSQEIEASDSEDEIQDKPTWEWAGKNNIMVCVRVRPMNRSERRKSTAIVRVLDERVVVVIDPKTQDRTRSFLDPLRATRTREKRYAFDHVFNPSAPQSLVFNQTTRMLVRGVIEGYNATVFAYGATGAGKTYTMLGTPSKPGCMFNTLQFLFDQIDEVVAGERVNYTVRISMIEIYNELIKDLLQPSVENLDLREDPIKGHRK